METLPHSILVLGLGRSGEAVAAFAARERAAGRDVLVTAVDERSGTGPEARAEVFRDLGATALTGVSEATGDHDLVVSCPGIPPSSPLMRSALAMGVPVISEIELAWRLSRAPWVAITGTNGKTTTTALTAHLLVESGIPAEAVGNFGPAAIGAVCDAGVTTVLVAEVSSFQLRLTERFHPRVAVLLNVTPDHIDWHGSMEAYAADKARVFDNLTPDDLAVIDVDDPGSAVYADRVESAGVRVCRVSRERRFPGGAYVAEGVLTVERPEGPAALVEVSALSIRGEHNISNALAAAAAALGAGATVDGVRAGLGTFAPIEHRLEPVATVDGVEWFNDSKATNPDAVLKALTAFDERPLVVLLGGRNKGSSFEDLAGAVSERARLAILFGEAAAQLEPAFSAAGGCTLTVGRMSDAVAAAAEAAESGDVVLLSPACASFDEFDSYEHRGRDFKRLVAAVAGASGSGGAS